MGRGVLGSDDDDGGSSSTTTSDDDDDGGSGDFSLDWGVPESDTTPELTEETIAEDDGVIVADDDDDDDDRGGGAPTLDWGVPESDTTPELTEETIAEEGTVTDDGGVVFEGDGGGDAGSDTGGSGGVDGGEDALATWADEEAGEQQTFMSDLGGAFSDGAALFTPDAGDDQDGSDGEAFTLDLPEDSPLTTWSPFPEGGVGDAAPDLEAETLEQALNEIEQPALEAAGMGSDSLPTGAVVGVIALAAGAWHYGVI